MDRCDNGRRQWLGQAGGGMVWLSTAAWAAALAGCGGGGSGGDDTGGAGGGGSGGGGSVSPATRAGTLEAVRGLVTVGTAAAPRFDAQALAAQIQALPGIAAAGVSTRVGNVWARFADGRYLVVPNRLEGVPATGSGEATPARAGDGRRQRLAATLPGGRAVPLASGGLDTPAILTGQQYRQLDMLGRVPHSASVSAAHFAQDWVDGDTLPQLRRMALGRGFTLPEIQLSAPPDEGFDNGVEGLRSIAGDGVFFITAQAAQAGPDDSPRTAVCVDTAATEANLARYEAELNAGVLVHSVHLRGVGGGWQAFNGFAITPAFADANGWQFPTECIGVFNLIGAEGLSDWVSALNRAQLRHILFWRGPVSWQRALAFADDLMQFNLATNAMDGRARRQPIEPRLRSYGMGETVGYLLDRGFVGDGAASLDYLQAPMPPQFVNTLLPTVDYALIRENSLELELVGQFGAPENGFAMNPRPGQPATTQMPAQLITGAAETARFEEPLLARAADPLLDGRRPLRQPNWEGGLLQTVIDHDDLSRGGWLQVINGGRCSNAVPITHWEIPFQAVTTVDGLTLTMTVTVRLRADVHAWRLDPDAFPRNGAPMAALAGSVHSRADYVASGSISHYDAASRTRTTVSWSGSGGVSNALGAFEVHFSGILGWDGRELRTVVLSVGGSRRHTQRRLVEEYDVNGELLRRSETTEDVPVVLTAFGPNSSGNLLELEFDDEWALVGNSWEMLPVPSDILPQPEVRQRRTRLSWPRVEPDCPPRKDVGGT